MSIETKLEWGCSNSRCWAKTKCERWLRRHNAKVIRPFHMDGVYCLKAKWIEKDELDRLHEKKRTD